MSDTEGGERRLDVVELLALAKILGRRTGCFVRDPDPGEAAWMQGLRARVGESSRNASDCRAADALPHARQIRLGRAHPEYGVANLLLQRGRSRHALGANPLQLGFRG